MVWLAVGGLPPFVWLYVGGGRRGIDKVKNKGSARRGCKRNIETWKIRSKSRSFCRIKLLNNREKWIACSVFFPFDKEKNEVLYFQQKKKRKEINFERCFYSSK